MRIPRGISADFVGFRTVSCDKYRRNPCTRYKVGLILQLLDKCSILDFRFKASYIALNDVTLLKYRDNIKHHDKMRLDKCSILDFRFKASYIALNDVTLLKYRDNIKHRDKMRDDNRSSENSLSPITTQWNIMKGVMVNTTLVPNCNQVNEVERI